MNWTGPRELTAHLLRLWERGELLRDAVTDMVAEKVRFPLNVTLKTPASADITARFDVVRAWSDQLASMEHCRIEWQEIRHRVQGKQRLPASLWIESLPDALALVGKQREWNRFAAQVAMTRKNHSVLLPWLEKKPLAALALHSDWARLLAVVSWCMQHHRPGIYLRQVDVPGVHTKFIEAHRNVLQELLDLALPPVAIDQSKTGISQFAARYGFLEKPVRLRFRVLDPDRQLLAGCGFPDMTLDADSFSRLNLNVSHVFITENETNFLAFPRVRSAIVIFGAGYGWQALAGSDWLNTCAIHYWGDIDTHGFGILNQLRGHFGHVASFLMDRQTLDAHEVFWGVEDKPLQVDLHRLTTAENNLYNDLRDNRVRAGLRLEQEHVGFGWLCAQLQALPDGYAESDSVPLKT